MKNKMSEYKLEFSGTTIPYSEHSRILQSRNTNKAFTISNNTLYELEFSTEALPTIRTSKDDEHPFGDDKLLYVEPFDDKQTAIIVKSIQGIRIYLHSKDTLYLAVEDDQYHDLFEWNKPGNDIHFGHFYHDASILAMMSSHAKYGTKFFAIFKDVLLSGDFPIYPLDTNLDIFEEHSPNSTTKMLADVNRDFKNSIVSRNRDGISVFELNAANGIEFVMKTSHGGAAGYDEGIFFADLSHQKYNDMIHFNSSGMFLYQYVESYKLIHYNPLFSEEKGWRTDHTKTVRFADINGDGYVDMVFTGPKGIAAITYNKHMNVWRPLIETSNLPPSMRHAQVMHVMPKVKNLTTDCYIFTHLDGIIHWAKVVSLPVRSPPKVENGFDPETTIVAASSMTPLLTTTGKVFQPIALLRDMNIWSGILNCINPDTGKPKFSLPLIDLPDPLLKLILYYDATSTANDVLGIGWSMPLNLIAMDDYGSVFDEDAVFVIAFQDSPQALVFLPKESTSLVRTYTLPSTNENLKFRAKFYPSEDQWVVDLGNGVRQIYGQIRSSGPGAISQDVVWSNWHGAGFDIANQVQRSRMWFLAKVQDDRDMAVLEIFYETYTAKVNSGNQYTTAVYIKKSRDYQGNEIEYRYEEKEKNEYKTYDVQDQEGNFNWEPAQTRYLTGYTFTTPSRGRQEVTFKYSTANGLRFLTEIHQSEDVINSFVAKFEYLTFPMGKFSLKRVQLPFEVEVSFNHSPVGDSNSSTELKRIDVSSDYKVTMGDDYVLVSFINGKAPGQVVLRMYNRDMTEELYSSDSKVKLKTKGRWPLLGEHGSVVGHDVIRGDDYFGVILFYAASKWLCLFGKAEKSEEWQKKSQCHEYGDQTAIQAGKSFCLIADPKSVVELYEWKPTEVTWNQQTIIAKADQISIAVHQNNFVTYDDNRISLGYKTNAGTWRHKTLITLYNCLSGTENILKRFNLKDAVHKVFATSFRHNLLKFNHNLVALNCLQINKQQLVSSLKLYTINRSLEVTDQQEVNINQDNLLTFISNEEKDTEGNYFKFKYEITESGEFYIKVADFRGPLLEKLKANDALQEKGQIMQQIEKKMNSPVQRLFIDLHKYIMSFTDKQIVCHDQKFIFGGSFWRRTTLTETERKRESMSIPLGDRFLLEKTNKESTVKLLQIGTRKVLSDLTVNLTDLRVFYPVYMATQAKGLAVRLVEFNIAEVKERTLSISETLSPYTNTLMLITHEGGDSKTVIFRQQYGIRQIQPNYVVNEVTVVFDADRKKRMTGYEYTADSTRLVGTAAVYSKLAIVPANNKALYGWLERSLKTGSSIAYNNRREIVRHIPFEDDLPKSEFESDEEEAFRKATTIYDKTGILEIAECAPFRVSEEVVGYYGFEDYEVNVIGGGSKHWHFDSKNVIRSGFALTGGNYLYQNTDPIEGIFQPLQQNAEYIASTWIRVHNVTEVPQIGLVTPYLTAIVLTASGEEVVSLLSEVKFRIDNWIYLELVVDIPLARLEVSDVQMRNNLQIAIRVGPTLDTPIDIDHVRFVPLISDFGVQIFDATTNLNTAVIQSTGSLLRMTHDIYNTVVSKTNEQNQIEEMTVYTKAGASKTPRSTVRVRPQMGFYEQFSPFSFANRWKIKETSQWGITPYQLKHHGDEKNNLELSTEDIITESFGFRVLYSLSGHRASITVNDFVELSENSNHWHLKVGNKGQPIPQEGEILLMKENDRLLVWIDGGLYIDQTSDAFNNRLTFSVTGSVRFKDMMVFSNAFVKVIYQNSLDEPIQEISLESAKSIVVKEKLYDELGRQRITTQNVRIVRSKNEPLLKYIPNFVTNDRTDQSDSIWRTGLLNGLATKIIGHPYGFVETRYEPNPLNERTTVGLPGKEFSSSGTFAKRFTSKTSNLFIANRYPLSMNVSYHIELKLGGIEDITVLNSKNKKIAHLLHVPGSKDIFSTYKLSDDGNLVQVLPPLYFEKVGNFHKTNADLLTVDAEDSRLQIKLGDHIDYNRNGKPIRKTTADAGPLENVYDGDKLLRFVLYYSYDKPSEVETIVYFTYDPVGRVLSSGQLLDTNVPKDKLLNLTLSKANTREYQSFNYANFERDPSLRGRLLRTVTMNGDEPFGEVVSVNGRGDALEKRIIVPNLTKTPDAISISKSYLGGRIQQISYPAQFFGQPFTLVYGYDKLGHINSIGIPGDPNKFLQIAYNAAGQVVEESFEPDSVYTFKHLRDYNEPGFLTKLQNPFQSEEIFYTESSYGGANRGDGSVTKIKFTANWHGLASSSGAGLSAMSFVNDFMSAKDSRDCFAALKTAGFLDDKNRQIKAFYPDLEMNLPIICTSGTTGRHISNVLGRYGYPREHGYRFDYSAHQDLTKAKYFIGTDEPQPLQPNTFAKEIPGVSPDASLRIWTALKSARFLVEDSDRVNLSTSHGKQGRKHFFASRIFEDLRNVNHDYAAYAGPLRKLLISRYFKRQANVTQLEMQNHIAQWFGHSSASFIQRAAADIFGMFRQKRYFLSPIDPQFQNVLKEFQPYFPAIVRVLFTYFAKQLGRSEFDVESYQIDANGNHRIFNTGFDQYSLKYEDSNRVEGVQYKGFDAPRREEVFPMKHDSRGNVIQALHKRIQAMQYHPVSNLLQNVKMVDGSGVQFYYDSKGERVLKRLTDVDGKVRKEIHYLRDEQGRALVERELNYLIGNQPPAVLITMYVYSASGLVGFVRRDQFYSVITDHQGSVRLIVRDGEVVAAYDYLPYGNLMRIFGADTEAHISYRYTGQEWDPEIGLYNYHARFYDPSIGRFYQIDPKEQYFSPYKYAGNSPVSMVDPSGEEAILLTIAIISALVGAYLGGASANGPWDFTKWKWGSMSTYLGIIFGGLTGAFLPGGLVASVGILSVFGMTAAIAITVSSGLAIAYLSAASANGSIDPRDWDFSSPRTYSALFDGFAMGATGINDFRKWGQIYKQLQATGRKLFIGATFVAGSGLFVMGGIATEWDIKKPQFWFATVSSLLAAPNLAMFGARGLKATKNGWKDLKKNVRTAMENYDDYVDTFFTIRKQMGRSIPETLWEISKANPELGAIAKTVGSAAAVGISTYLMGSALNRGFTNWNMTDVSTYQNLLTAIQLGGQAAATGKHSLVAVKRKLHLTKAIEAKELTDKVAKLAGQLYKDLIKEKRVVTVIRNGKKVTHTERVIPRDNENYSKTTSSRLSRNQIPNTAMSVVVAGDIVMVGFSTNRAPGIYLVYSHENLLTPTIKDYRIVDNNGILAGGPVAVRDNTRLATKIGNAIMDFQNGIKDNNKLIYQENHLRNVLTEHANSDLSVDANVRRNLVTAIDNEIMDSGFVDRGFIAGKIEDFGFENANIRIVRAEVENVRQQHDDVINQLREHIENPFHQAALEAHRERLEIDLIKMKTDLEVVVGEEQRAYLEKLYQPVEHLRESLTHWEHSNCAEPHTLLALERQRKVFDQEYFTRRSYDIQHDIDFMATYTTRKLPAAAIGFPRCDNCLITTKFVQNVLTEKTWMTNLQKLSEQALDRAKASGKQFHFLVPIIHLQKTIEEEQQRKNGKIRHRRSNEEDMATTSKWYQKLPKWLQSFRRVPKNPTKSYSRTNKTVVEFGDEFLSRIDVNGTLLLADVILAKYNHRNVHQTSSNATHQVHTAEVMCRILQLFDDCIEEAATVSGISLDTLNVNSFSMQQEVMPVLRKHQFDRASEIMLDYAMRALNSEVVKETRDAFRCEIQRMKLTQMIEEMHVRIRAGANIEKDYNASDRRRNTKTAVSGVAMLSYDTKRLN